MLLTSRISAGLCAGLLAAAFCGAGGCAKKAEVPFSHVKVFICEPALQVFHTQADWDKFWTEHKPYGRDAAVPQVDFGRYQAVLVSSGRTNAGAVNVSIPRVNLNNNIYAEVVIHTAQAGENCAVTRAVACPTDVIVLPNTYTVRLTEETVVRNCRDR